MQQVSVPRSSCRASGSTAKHRLLSANPRRKERYITCRVIKMKVGKALHQKTPPHKGSGGCTKTSRPGALAFNCRPKLAGPA
jgi:hypothetical protein